MDALEDRTLNATKICGGERELFESFNEMIHNKYQWLEYNEAYTHFSVIKTHTPLLHLSSPLCCSLAAFLASKWHLFKRIQWWNQSHLQNGFKQSLALRSMKTFLPMFWKWVSEVQHLGLKWWWKLRYSTPWNSSQMGFVVPFTLPSIMIHSLF